MLFAGVNNLAEVVELRFDHVFFIGTNILYFNFLIRIICKEKGNLYMSCSLCRHTQTAQDPNDMTPVT